MYKPLLVLALALTTSFAQGEDEPCCSKSACKSAASSCGAIGRLLFGFGDNCDACVTSNVGQPPAPCEMLGNPGDAPTGRLMYGVGVNCDAGVIGNVCEQAQPAYTFTAPAYDLWNKASMAWTPATLNWDDGAWLSAKNTCHNCCKADVADADTAENIDHAIDHPRLHHLRRATIHLRAAGLTADANRIEPQVIKLETELLLDRKMAELEQLQHEVDELRKTLETADQKSAGMGPDSSVEQIIIHCHVLEVSPAKLRDAGVDFLGTGKKACTVDEFISMPRQPALLDADQVKEFLKVVKSERAGRVLARPTIIAVSGHEAFFNAGGEVPYIKRKDKGEATVGFRDFNTMPASIGFRDFGTRLKILPTVQSDGTIRLDAHLTVSRLTSDQGQNEHAVKQAVAEGDPQIETCCDLETAVALRSGQTAVLTGPVQTRKQSEECQAFKIPYLGIPVRVTKQTDEELQTVVLLSPETLDVDFVDEAEREEVTRREEARLGMETDEQEEVTSGSTIEWFPSTSKNLPTSGTNAPARTWADLVSPKKALPRKSAESKKNFGWTR